MLFYNLVTILYFDTIAWLVVQTLSQGCHNLGIILPQPYHKVVTMYSQSFITKLATTLYSVTRVSHIL